MSTIETLGFKKYIESPFLKSIKNHKKNLNYIPGSGFSLLLVENQADPRVQHSDCGSARGHGVRGQSSTAGWSCGAADRSWGSVHEQNRRVDHRDAPWVLKFERVLM